MRQGRGAGLLAWSLAALVGLVFLLAGIAKGIAPERTLNALVFLFPDGTPGGVPYRHIIAILAAWEIAIGGLLLVARGRVTLVLGIATLLLFSASLATFAMDPQSPSCGCAPIADSAAGVRGALLAIGRNILLIGVLVWLWPCVRIDRRDKRGSPDLQASGDGPSSSMTGEPRAAAGAFTLIELLAAVAVISVLVTLLAVALAPAREAARDARALSRLSQSLVALDLYAGDYRDAFPYVGPPGDPFAPQVYGDVVLSHVGGYFWVPANLWPTLLHPTYLARRDLFETEASREWVSDFNLPESVIRTPIRLSQATQADPRWFEGEGLPADLALYRATRHGEVLFPSAKGILFDPTIDAFTRTSERHGPGFLPLPAGFGLADGSAGIRPWLGADTPLAVARPFPGFSPMHVHATRSGLRGRDF